MRVTRCAEISEDCANPTRCRPLTHSLRSARRHSASELVQAAYDGSISSLEALYSAGTNLDALAPPPVGWTPPYEHADPGASGEVTPLSAAAKRGHVAVLEWLLERGASVAPDAQASNPSNLPAARLRSRSAGRPAAAAPRRCASC